MFEAVLWYNSSNYRINTTQKQEGVKGEERKCEVWAAEATKERWRKEKKGDVRTLGKRPGWATNLQSAYYNGRGNLYLSLLSERKAKRNILKRRFSHDETTLSAKWGLFQYFCHDLFFIFLNIILTTTTT
jgi:hypothetical protein